uniref:Uncharacterized protein n=1 Tax=Dinoroseobacter phage vB_DshS_R26L TaxID=3161158 RepID=A0AAU7VG24_9CAUD
MTDLMDQIRAIDPGACARAVQDAALRCREAAQSPRLSERATAGAAFKRLTDVLEMGTTAIDPHSPFAFQGGRQR